MKIDIIIGARPNFMKAAALFVISRNYPNLDMRLIHTGQHYDANMSHVFLEDLGLPEPRYHLEVGSGSHTHQTAQIMMGYEECVQEDPPDLCVVVGDVNSTVACAMVAAKVGIPIAHVEAGLRSFDRSMPEEINRVLTDSIADLMFVTESSGVENLRKEGRPPESIHLVGNTMIDTLHRFLPGAEQLEPWCQFGVKPKAYAYLTLHRPSNVDNERILEEICEQILWLSEKVPVILLVHPRTKQRLEASKLEYRLKEQPDIYLSEPLGYMDSLALLLKSKLVVTDSGGLQEETTALKIPCLTLRQNTERPITVEQGTNTIIGRNWELFRNRVQQIEAGEYPRRGSAIPYWDGKVGRRIMDILACQL